MSTVLETRPAARTALPAAAQAPFPTESRFDLYATIHKALRLFMTDTLTRLGRLDVGANDEVAATLEQLDELLNLCRRHAAHENDFIHAAMEARRPGSSLAAAQEHDDQHDAIAALGADAAALRARPTAAAAHRLYRHLAVFVAENLQHMNVEETAHNAALWAAYDDAGLVGIHQRLLASVGAAEMVVVLRWMVPAMTPAERLDLVRGLQRQMPPEAMRDVLALVRRHLDDSAWSQLARVIGIAPVPGLVAA